MYQGTEYFNATPGALKTVVVEEFPEVLMSTRAYQQSGIINNNGDLVREGGIRYADPEILQMFFFPLISGDPNTALKEAFSLLLTEEMAQKYFGSEDPMSKVLNISDHDYQITGILANIPKNSHFTFDFLTSFNTLFSIRSSGRAGVERWGSNSIWNTFILAQKNIDYKELETKITGLLKKYEGQDSEHQFRLQPLTSIHLHSRVNFDASNVSDIRYIYLFSAIAFLILLLACLNYMNLSTARSVKRAKEVGVRKVVGANKSNLIYQFLRESLLYTIISFVLALILVCSLLPAFGQFVERDLSVNFLYNWKVIIKFIGILFFLSLVSGSYPAIFLSSIQPVRILRSSTKSTSNRSSAFRNSLVVIQFIISIALISCSLTIYSQLKYISNKNIGLPLAYYAMNRWLENFAYRFDLSINVFVISILTTLLIALVTVGYHSIKAALSNPVDCLTYE